VRRVISKPDDLPHNRERLKARLRKAVGKKRHILPDAVHDAVVDVLCAELLEQRSRMANVISQMRWDHYDIADQRRMKWIADVILEHYQDEQGKIKIPDRLVSK